MNHKYLSALWEYSGDPGVNNADGWFFLCICVTSFISLKEKSDNQLGAQ